MERVVNPRAILFGSIGTLVETSELQRRAFNQAFGEAGLDWVWTPEIYRTLLARPGGRNRIARYAADRGEWVDALALHERKTELFNRMIIEHGLDARSGVIDVIGRAKAEGVALGFASTTSRRNIDAVFKGLNGTITSSDFDFIGDKSFVSGGKPAPDIYIRATEQLDVDPRHAIAIEDTAPSVRSAISAGLPCIAFPGAYASKQSFNTATTVVDRLSWQEVVSTTPTSSMAAISV